VGRPEKLLERPGLLLGRSTGSAPPELGAPLGGVDHAETLASGVGTGGGEASGEADQHHDGP
jgi:hypothetical protein